MNKEKELYNLALILYKKKYLESTANTDLHILHRCMIAEMKFRNKLCKDYQAKYTMSVLTFLSFCKKEEIVLSNHEMLEILNNE